MGDSSNANKKEFVDACFWLAIASILRINYGMGCKSTCAPGVVNCFFPYKSPCSNQAHSLKETLFMFYSFLFFIIFGGGCVCIAK